MNDALDFLVQPDDGMVDEHPGWTSAPIQQAGIFENADEERAMKMIGCSLDRPNQPFHRHCASPKFSLLVPSNDNNLDNTGTST